jgi:hypothetical protein
MADTESGNEHGDGVKWGDEKKKGGHISFFQRPGTS